MEIVLIKREIPKTQYENMGQKGVDEYVKIFSGRLIRIEEIDDIVVLYIAAPSTWRIYLMQSLLLPYRYI